MLLAICGCGTDVEGVPGDTKSEPPTIEETEPPVILLDNLEYWDVVQDEIVDMLHSHNLYMDNISHAYPCVQFYVQPGIVTEDGKIVASGLTQEEYKDVFEFVKSDLHMILDKYKIGKPKTILHGCNSIVEIFFDNWFINESKVYDRVYSRWIASYGLDLLEYYYEYEENSYVVREGFSTDVWAKYPVYKP
jgi:hypothetical protein